MHWSPIEPLAPLQTDYYLLKELLFISIKFEERSEGADEILIWIPQASVAIGSFIFFICVFHHLVFSVLNKKIN